MKIIISNSSDIPIYEQIYNNIKEQILVGKFVGNEMLPSIRSLAKELRISNITTKRAYEELVKDGYIEAISSKGYFVKSRNKNYLKEEILKKVEEKIIDVLNLAKTYNVSDDELMTIINNLMEER